MPMPYSDFRNQLYAWSTRPEARKTLEKIYCQLLKAGCKFPGSDDICKLVYEASADTEKLDQAALGFITVINGGLQMLAQLVIVGELM